MDIIKYQLDGEMYDEKIKIQYGNAVIYNNYVDDLVTSTSGTLEFKLNFEDLTTISPVIVKFIESQIILVPKCPECFNKKYNYIPIILSQEKFKELWTAMKYDDYEDIQKLNQISSEEILLMWFISSNCRYAVDNIKDYLKCIHSKILYVSKEDDLLQDLINKLLDKRFEELNIENTIIEITDKMEKIFFYLDEKTNYEWDAFRIDDNRNIYLHLGMNKCIPVFKK